MKHGDVLTFFAIDGVRSSSFDCAFQDSRRERGQRRPVTLIITMDLLWETQKTCQ